jgi:flagellar protein FlbD
MIKLTRLNGQEMIINADLIELIEARPDTIVTMNTGEKYIVREAVDDIIARISRYKQSLSQPPPTNE